MNLKDFDPVETNCKLHSSENFSAIVEGNNWKSVFSALQIYCSTTTMDRSFLSDVKSLHFAKYSQSINRTMSLKELYCALHRRFVLPAFSILSYGAHFKLLFSKKGHEEFQFPATVVHPLYPIKLRSS